MSRHNRKVPTSFYHRFARDACAFADRYARGSLVSVLEGGYSDRALTSGAMAHLSGLVDINQLGSKIDEEWWNVENLVKVAHNYCMKNQPTDSLPFIAGESHEETSRGYALAAYSSYHRAMARPGPDYLRVPRRRLSAVYDTLVVAQCHSVAAIIDDSAGPEEAWS